MREKISPSGEGLFPPLSEPQINVLRYFGKGLSRKKVANELHIDDKKFRRELQEVFDILGVDGEIPAVMQALKLGVLDVDADGLLDPDFELKQFYRLTRNERNVLDLLVESKSTTLDRKKLEEKGIETSREPNQYVESAIHKVVEEKIGLPSRIQVLVHYFAFQNSEEFLHSQAVDQGVNANSLKLVNQELQFLKFSNEGLLPSAIANRLNIKVDTVRWYRKNVCNKLGAKNLGEAIEKARELGFLKK